MKAYKSILLATCLGLSSLGSWASAKNVNSQEVTFQGKILIGAYVNGFSAVPAGFAIDGKNIYALSAASVDMYQSCENATMSLQPTNNFNSYDIVSAPEKCYK